MKLIFILFSILLVSCQDTNFINGDCIQKPDESTVWEISDIKEGKATIVQSGPNVPEIAMEIRIDSSWIKTKCRL